MKYVNFRLEVDILSLPKYFKDILLQYFMSLGMLGKLQNEIYTTQAELQDGPKTRVEILYRKGI